MRKRITFLVLVAALMCWPPRHDAAPRASDDEWQEYGNRKETNLTIKLTSGASVEVAGIGGPVYVETSDGDSAEANIVRSAATPEELACYDVVVKSMPASLEIRYVQYGERPNCGSVRARQSVKLRLPRTVDLRLSTIAGDVTVGRLEGSLSLENIAGHVSMEQTRSAEVSNLASGLEMKLSGSGAGGVSISNVVGRVELRLAEGLSADVRVSNVVGEVRSESADLRLTKTSQMSYRAQSGAGGNHVSVSNVRGEVTLRRFD